ncbi:MAG: hypothetical protein ACRCXZ_10575 [Patescibacteria group bacterium]
MIKPSFQSVFFGLFACLTIASCSQTKDGGSNITLDLGTNNTTANIQQDSDTNQKLNLNSTSEFKLIQSLIDSLEGGAVIVDSKGLVVAKKNETKLTQPASIIKLVTIGEYLKWFKPNDSFKGKTNLAISQELMLTSNNLLAEEMAARIGIDKIQTKVRSIIKDESFVYGNGSGCNDGSFGTEERDCGYLKSELRTTMVSPLQMYSYLRHLESSLRQTGTTFEELSSNIFDENSSLNYRYADRLKHLPKLKFYGKVGGLTRNPMSSIAGILHSKNGNKYYIIIVSQGQRQKLLPIHSRIFEELYKK